MQTVINKKPHESNTKPFVAPTPIVQKKLALGSANDAYEVEADAIADQVVAISNSSIAAITQSSPLIQQKCTNCEQEENIQMKPLANQISPLIQKSAMTSVNASIAPDRVSTQISSSKGGGSIMGNDTRNFMESRFGTDFSGVRIHIDSNAIQLSRQLNAQAFTVGNDVYFNEGKYNPSSNTGKHLLAHELVHTVQQGGIRRKIQRVIARQTTCSNTPLNLPGGGIINDPIIELTIAVNRAVQIMDEAIDELTFARDNIIQGQPIAWPTISDSLALAIRVIGNNPESNHFWTGRGIGTVRLLLRRISAIRNSLAGNGMFYICLGPQVGRIGICEGPICSIGNAATCPGSFTINLCEGYWNQNLELRAGTLIHEASHNFADFIGHNLRLGHASCYTRFVQTAAGVDIAAQRVDLCPNP